MKEYYGCGKLMLTGEYTVLDGAESIALRLNVGQKLVISPSEDEEQVLLWDSVDMNGDEWFWAVFSPHGEVLSTTDLAVSSRLSSFLKVCMAENPSFRIAGLHAEMHSEFDLNWGLGSSSSLIYVLSQWAEISPFHILNKAFTGSGYDIAAAHPSPHDALLYSVADGTPQWKDIDFHPSYSDELYFVYSGRKQDSRQGIKAYRTLSIQDRTSVIPSINDINVRIMAAETLGEFEKCVDEHERIMSYLLGIKTLKEEKFADYDGGSVKSLGAWGGDFFLATGKTAPEYFQGKGFDVILPFRSLTEK